MIYNALALNDDVDDEMTIAGIPHKVTPLENASGYQWDRIIAGKAIRTKRDDEQYKMMLSTMFTLLLTKAMGTRSTHHHTNLNNGVRYCCRM